ncbi:GAF domain-containing sensor histidine kinase [Pleurocapsa sp. PCC 7319]|uniref:sensor histidine kinase n=1 Tax=Pleurocapsa sp. PCC 7319 TaxID=118161 RepID=UPI00034AF0D4|nr:GAF domain-containing sensor histidine kinase [Pleurocapsa sp. PCC 7319]
MPLENRNSSLNSDRTDNQRGVISDSEQCISLLEATTNLASALLSDEDLDRGVNRALEILGISTEADRLNLLQHHDSPKEQVLGHVIAQYEWLSPYANSQLNHPKLQRIPYDGIEDCYQLFIEGKHWGGLLDTMAEPFRSGQLELGVKATYGIPIMIKGQYWGVIGLDFCRTARFLANTEIAVLKTAATCIGSAIERDRICREQERIKCVALLEKERAIELEKRDRILAITTNAAQALLNNQDLEQGISLALQIIGEGIDTDRVVVMEHCNQSDAEALGHLKVLFEWHSPHAISQLHHPNLQQVSYEGIEDWYEQLSQGKAMGGIVDEFPEPVRSGQMEIGVKSTYAIPIAIDDQYWGIVAFDDCREAKQRSETEISILKTTAVCIGGAIEKNRVRKQQDQAKRQALLEQQNAKQLTEHNLILEKRDRILAATAEASNVLLTGDNLDKAVNKALKIIGKAADTDRAAVAEHFENLSNQTLGHLKLLYEWHTSHTPPQLTHNELSQIPWEEAEEIYSVVSQGQTHSGVINEMNEPFRSKQKKINVKSTYTVPIMVNGRFWGIAAFDDCREETRRSEAEISILKTAAACLGGAIEQERTRLAKEQAERNILQEREKVVQERAIQLAEHNQVLEKRDRLLAATAKASNVLLTGGNFDESVNKALQIIGESLDTDRVTVIENWHNPSQPSIPHWRLLYEWNSPQTLSQISYPEVTQGSYEGIEKWYELQSRGESISCRLAEIPEPFRSGQEKVGVKVLHAVPIFIEGKYWGLAGFDDCRQETLRSEAELSILKTAAACIGGAIQQNRIRRAKEEAERNILLEREQVAIEKAAQLEASNQILSLRDRWLEATANAANKLLEITDLDQGINAALKVLGESLDCDRVTVVQYFEDANGFVRLIYEWDSPYASSQISHPELNKISAKGIEDWLVKLKAGEWIGGTIDELKEPFRSSQLKLDVKATYSIPVFVNNHYWGAICIDFCRELRHLTTPEIAVFQTAASCIGSAIYRQQIQQDKELAELAILDERNRMAREIHDTLAQAFTGISLQLEAAKNILITQPETAQERLLQAKNLAKEGLTEARRSVRALRPEALESGKLTIALHQLVDSMTSGTGTKAKVIIEGDSQLTSEIEVDLFRIAQEAVTNTLRHAQATELIVRLICKTDSVYLQIKDNGIGFEAQQLLNSSFGLIGIQERCDRLGGNLVITSAVGQGTEIVVTVAV